MARLALNKSSLHRESSRLRTFERFLPTLDLKRRQLIAERAKADKALRAIEDEIEGLRALIARDIPMLSYADVDLAGLVAVRDVRLTEENVMGTRLPVLASVQVRVRPYALLGKPHWVDEVARRAQAMLSLRLRAQLARRRLHLLEEAVKKITQRFNLFDKVLIPRTRDHLRRIRIHLADAERAGVVRAKLAKTKHAHEAASRSPGRGS